MDDPWGSPWADEALSTHEASISENAPTHENASTVTTAARKATANEVAGSPWEKGDEEFGGWAALPEEVNGSDHKQDVEVWGVQESEDVLIDTSRPGWFTRDMRPHNGTDTLKATSPPIRGSSPDPWTNIEGAQPTDGGLDISKGASHEISDGSSGTGENSKRIADRPSVPCIEGHANGESTHKSVSTDAADTSVHLGPSVEIDIRHSVSTLGSSLEDDRQAESSRTSFEDEPKSAALASTSNSPLEVVQRPEKAQHVNHEPKHDVIPPEQGTDKALDEEEDDDGDDFGEFGDFEEGDNQQRFVADGHGGEVAHNITTDKQSLATALPLGETEVVLVPVAFENNLNLVDAIFPQEHPLTSPILDKDLPDDSQLQGFDSIEQRKIWYRISRYGTMSKHNTGNDDNYTRVTFAKSNTRDETLKIVARWMEEDRIGRGVVLGGSNRLGSLFGWRDTVGLSGFTGMSAKERARASAPPASRKHNTTRSPSSSRRSKGSLSRHSSLDRTIDLKSAVKTPVPVIAAQFSWSSSQPTPMPETTSGSAPSQTTISRPNDTKLLKQESTYKETATSRPVSMYDFDSKFQPPFTSQQPPPESSQTESPLRPLRGEVVVQPVASQQPSLLKSGDSEIHSDTICKQFVSLQDFGVQGPLSAGFESAWNKTPAPNRLSLQSFGNTGQSSTSGSIAQPTNDFRSLHGLGVSVPSNGVTTSHPVNSQTLAAPFQARFATPDSKLAEHDEATPSFADFSGQLPAAFRFPARISLASKPSSLQELDVETEQKKATRPPTFVDVSSDRNSVPHPSKSNQSVTKLQVPQATPPFPTEQACETVARTSNVPLSSSFSITPPLYQSSYNHSAQSHAPSLALQTSETSTNINGLEDDDDWGEMISSPITNPPKTPPSQRPSSMLNPISSSDLDDFFGVSRGHKPKLSLSEEIASANKVESILGSPALHSPRASPGRRLTRTSVSSVGSTSSNRGNPSELNIFDSPVPAAVTRIVSVNKPRRPSRLSMGASSTPSFVPGYLPTIVSPAPTTLVMPTATSRQESNAPRQGTYKSRNELEHDRTVQNIVQSLPDLSYMLKR